MSSSSHTCLPATSVAAGRLLAERWRRGLALERVLKDGGGQGAASPPQQPSSLQPPGDALCVVTPSRLTSTLRGAGRAAQQPESSLCNASKHRMLHGLREAERGGKN